MAEPAKLELLTRKPGGVGFTIHQVTSTQAYQHYRPRRLPDDAWEIRPQPRSVDGSRAYMLRHLGRDRYVLLDAREYFLWQCFDGSHSLDDAARALLIEFGSFDFEFIGRLLTKLHQTELLQSRDEPELQQAIAHGRQTRLAKLLVTTSRLQNRFNYTIPNGDALCAAIYRFGGFLLFHQVTLWLLLAVVAAAAFAAYGLSERSMQLTQIATKAPVTSAIAIGALLLVSTLLHILMHALACKAFGRRVRALGFFLYQGVVPNLYADVTDIFMSSRRGRLVVDLAGPMVEVIIGAAAFLAAYYFPPGLSQAICFAIGVLLWNAALVTLYPFNFLDMDGYNIVADLLAMPTLRQQAFALAPALPRRLLSLKTITRAEWVQLGYLALCLISVVVYAVMNIQTAVEMVRTLSLFSF